MTSTLLSQSWRASARPNFARPNFARKKLRRFTALAAVAFLLFAATNASLLWSDSLTVDVAKAHHSAAPEDVAVVPGNGKLHVSWRPEPEHSYQLRWRVGDEVASSWNTVENPGTYRYEIRGLANRTDYDVQVRSQRSGAQTRTSGQSTFSDWSRVQSAEPRALAGTSNDTPSWRITHDSVSVEENSLRTGSIAKFTAIGGDTNDVVNYHLLEPVRGPFAINAASGDVYVYEKLDFESVEEYTVTVGATDLGNATIRHDLTVDVIDVAGPDIPTVTQVCAGNQSAFLVWSQTNEATYDIQWRQFDNVEYSAANSRNIRNIDADRRIVENLANGVDWVFRIRAVDKANGEQSKWSAEYVVSPSVAENRANTPPAFREPEYEFSVREEIAAGADVGSVSATDDDPYSQFIFAIGETEPPNAPFEIHPQPAKLPPPMSWTTKRPQATRSR